MEKLLTFMKNYGFAFTLVVIFNKLFKSVLARITRNSDVFYMQDYMYTVRNLVFRKNQNFQRSLKVASGKCNNSKIFQNEWRINIACWAAVQALQHDGDFVECGVMRGSSTTCIMEYINWNSLDRKFYLLDTFSGLDDSLVFEHEKNRSSEINQSRPDYQVSYENVCEHFSLYKNVVIIKGAVPHTLSNVDSNKIAYLHLDMNCARPEVEALEYFWPKLVSGGIVLLDDYGFHQYEDQQEAHDGFAKKHGLEVLLSPSGQGIIIKP